MIRVYESVNAYTDRFVRECAISEALAADWKPWTIYRHADWDADFDRSQFVATFG